jgi:uncharacterized protein YbjT (DUF2867 family)
VGGDRRVKVLVTGVTGYVGAAVVPALVRDGHQVRGFARDPRRAGLGIEIIKGDAVSEHDLGRALDGIEVAYYLLHSMDARSAADGQFAETERVAAERFARVAVDSGVRRIVYVGGILPSSGTLSPHLASRAQVEKILLEAIPDSVAFRASIVIGARSRSFRFLVRLVERLPVMAVPAWSTNRTQPIDERDIVAILARAATNRAVAGLSLDVAGPDVVTYGQLIARIQELMLVHRPTVSFKRLTVTPIASRLGALIAGEQHELIGPLMESLDTDLLPRDQRTADLLGVRLHRLDAAIERALRAWEASEPLAAR